MPSVRCISLAGGTSYSRDPTEKFGVELRCRFYCFFLSNPCKSRIKIKVPNCNVLKTIVLALFYRICGWPEIQLSYRLHSKPALLWRSSHWGKGCPTLPNLQFFVSISWVSFCEFYAIATAGHPPTHRWFEPLVEMVLTHCHSFPPGPCPFLGAESQALQGLAHVPQRKRPPHLSVDISWGSSVLLVLVVTRPSVFIYFWIGFWKHDMILVNNDMEYSGGTSLSSETVRANLGCRSSLLPVRSTSGYHQLKIFKSDSSSEILIFLWVILEVRWVEALCEAPSSNFSGTSRRFLFWTILLVRHKIMLLYFFYEK